MKVLLVDDEELIVKGLKFSLIQDGWDVEYAPDGEIGLAMIKANTYDIVLLDHMMPGLDGLQVLSAVREFSRVPIIMLTAKSDDMDKVLGLDFGADDYITKPFNVMEVKSRIKAILRRVKGDGAVMPSAQGNGTQPAMDSQSTINAGSVNQPAAAYSPSEPTAETTRPNVNLDSNLRRVRVEGRVVELTGKEYELLRILMSDPGRLFTREQLLSLVWQQDGGGDDRTVDVTVRRLREKLETNPKEPKYICTSWGRGYYYGG